ncbi:MAG: hypothetical protein CO077_00020 [Candidatus Nealsonbacteria bacterium CG_4_9_14_0_8_um_filter_35_12]|uniref:Uncharacterized protein n=1 Tax=Candidatus Nealsonbacteria bacterium CG_4_9_14_0_8_um_filter_35_12 TaxID=1974692 RepID=A0A2M8DNQ1_9BACT|nr:MAG: hypothetical protein CO077_00020 [Candidatus Nealsonbacteria bacterium CG_4_9_14_0_8_um_filter_35_12]
MKDLEKKIKELEKKIFGKHFWFILAICLSFVTAVALLAAFLVHPLFVIVLLPCGFSLWLCSEGYKITKKGE